jgi:hypothetical protein
LSLGRFPFCFHSQTDWLDHFVDQLASLSVLQARSRYDTMTREQLTPQALDLLCQEAGHQAASWQAGAATAAAEPTPWRSTVVLASVCSVLALAVIAAPLVFEPVNAVSVPAPVTSQAAATSELAAVVSTSPAEPIRWEGGELVIDVDRMPLATAIPLLAGATSTPVSGAHLLTSPVYVTLHLRTRDVNAAWHHLLHGHASFSTSCSASACQVWINSEVAASAATAAPVHDNAPLANEREPMSRERREELDSQPDGSC